MTSHDHFALRRRVVLTGKVVARTAMHIGAGRQTDVTAVDASVVRDGLGRPYIPGSSFKGVLRSAVESLIRGLDADSYKACDPFDDKASDPNDRSCSKRVEDRLNDAPGNLTERKRAELTLKESCTVCRIFGCAGFAGKLRIEDLPLLGELDLVEARHGVGIHRDRRVAQRGVLYDYEAVPAGSAFGLRLTGENLSDVELGFVAAGLSALHDGLGAIGGKGTRGLGAVEVLLNAPVERKASDFFGKLDPLPDETGGSTAPDEALVQYLEAVRTALAG